MTIKKYLNTFHWYENDEICHLPVNGIISPEYPSNYQIYFGVIPVNFLKISDNVLPLKNYKKLQKYLISENFVAYELSYGSYKFVNLEKKIVITGDVYTQPEKDTGDDDDDDDISYGGIEVPTPSEECMFISVHPTIKNREFLETFFKKVLKFMVDVSKDDSRFYLIAENQRGLFTQRTKFKAFPIKENRYDLFYGKLFPHDKIKKFITDETENLLLLHGDPGTGKSNYIKHIITNSKKKVIYIPPTMLGVISSPGFVSFMMQNKNTILLIEDAEEVLSINRNSATNNLLGLTDGFLKDALNLKIIATFNCDIGKIDPALLRKGRMYLEYKFDKLSVEECEELANFLNIKRTFSEPMTLAEFFIEEDNHVKNSFEQRRIGFI